MSKRSRKSPMEPRNCNNRNNCCCNDLTQEKSGCSRCANTKGVVLLITLVLLVILSMLSYMLCHRVALRRHRDNYIIAYQAARYGCDSAVKYTLNMMQDMNTPVLVARPNEPDFSDLFAMNEEEYQQLLDDWAAEMGIDINDINNILERSIEFDELEGFYDINNIDASNDINNVNDLPDFNELTEPNMLTIRGPYGPPWPFINKPIEFEIASTDIRIQIEDENAKYPISWVLLEDKKTKRETYAGFETFCEWMDINDTEIDDLQSQLDEIIKLKAFKLEYKPIIKKEVTPRRPVRRSKRRRSNRKRAVRQKVKRTTISANVHYADFAKFFHGTLLDTEVLARSTIISENRKESALKYMGMWGSTKVNINTAPRQVLEAVFVFGGDAEEIAEEIIQRRRIKPFHNIEELRTSLFRYSESVRKPEKYITTVSNFFTIRITARSGVAEAFVVIAVRKSGEKMERIAIITG